MQEHRLPKDARIGQVRLRIADLERSLRFYGNVLGLRPLPGAAPEVQLSPTGKPPALVALVENRDAPRRPPRSSGLFHFALLVPTRRDLGRAFLHMRELEWSFQGFADHAVSESLYLADPEGNGIEIYADRPRSEWTMDQGEMHITTDALDLDSVIEAAGPPEPWTSLAERSIVGHVHLEARALDATEAFYTRLIGFDPTLRSYPGARFMSAGGYHHHLALNTWNHPRGAPPEGSLGLVDYEIVVPENAARAALRERLAAAGIEIRSERKSPGLEFDDPDGVRIVVTG